MTSILKTLRDNSRSYLGWCLLVLLIIVPLSAAMTMLVLHEGDTSRPYVPELRKIAEQTPLYPGCKKTGENVVLKRTMAYFSTNYQCDARFAELEAFYARVLPQQGWIPPKRTNPIIYDMNNDHYRRGDYFIAVDQDGAQSSSFSIVFIWAPQ